MAKSEKAVAALQGLVDAAGSQAALASKLGVSEATISKVLSGDREPGPKVLRAIGFERLVTYVPKGEARAWWDVLAGKLPVAE